LTSRNEAIKGLYVEKEKKRLEKIKKAAIKGQDFDFINDYSSSDYEVISQEEIDHLNHF